jgi:hypothetical protein
MALTFSPDPPHLAAGAGTAIEQSSGLRMLADHESGGWVAARGPDIINNGHFDENISYWQIYGATAAWANGACEVQVPGGTAAPFDVLLVTNVPSDAAGTYEVSFKAHGSVAHTITVAYAATQTVALTPTENEFYVDLVVPDPQPAGQLQFALGGSATPWVFTLDDVRLERIA